MTIDCHLNKPRLHLRKYESDQKTELQQRLQQINQVLQGSPGAVRQGRPPAKASTKLAKPKRRMSAAARKKMAAVAKARWAKAKAAGRKRL